jgi:very-short-patch-repair endonuclease
MTPAERALRAGLRRSFPHVHFRYQAPIGPFYADIVCHGAKLVIEVDGSQHQEALEYDADRTTFLEGRGYRVLRFWNNQVLTELESVLTAIASHLPSPLAGEGGLKGRMGGARRSRARTPSPHPLPSPPRKWAPAKVILSRGPKGEGGNDKPPVWSS